MSDTHPSIFSLTNKVEKNQEPNKVFSHTEENRLHLIERNEEGRREREKGFGDVTMPLFHDSHPPALMLLDYGSKHLASDKETVPFPVEKRREERAL